MGHMKRKRPRRGSLGFWPRKRAQDIVARVKNWADKKEPKLLGFAGYKAGMTAVILVDNRPRVPTKGEEVRRPVTIIEAPPMKIISVRLYSKDAYGFKVMGEVLADNLDKHLARAMFMPKKRKSKLDDLKAKLHDAVEVRVIAHTQPQSTGFAKKTPDIVEFPIGGTLEEGFNYALSILGKEVSVTDILKSGEYVDVHAISKGKGIQGDIKRYGIKLANHKSEFGVRHRATMGPITPAVCGWWVAQPGQMGYSKRTEYNKQILKIADAKTTNVNPVSGIYHYGTVRSTFILVSGSVPGAKKRLVVLSNPIRPQNSTFTQAPEITLISTRSQQG
ncbi:MAG: 50S ribosomal protein L3 [archaeon]